MTEKSVPAGFVVQLTIPGKKTEGGTWRGAALEDAPTFQFFNVAIAADDKAVEAARKKISASEEAPMRTVRTLSASEIAFLGMRSGEVRPA
jgi:hypothetical protein